MTRVALLVGSVALLGCAEPAVAEPAAATPSRRTLRAPRGMALALFEGAHRRRRLPFPPDPCELAVRGANAVLLPALLEQWGLGATELRWSREGVDHDTLRHVIQRARGCGLQVVLTPLVEILGGDHDLVALDGEPDLIGHRRRIQGDTFDRVQHRITVGRQILVVVDRNDGLVVRVRLIDQARQYARVTEIDSGCCGVAGSFGYEHYDLSMKIGSQRLLPAGDFFTLLPSLLDVCPRATGTTPAIQSRHPVRTEGQGSGDVRTFTDHLPGEATCPAAGVVGCLLLLSKISGSLRGREPDHAGRRGGEAAHHVQTEVLSPPKQGLIAGLPLVFLLLGEEVLTAQVVSPSQPLIQVVDGLAFSGVQTVAAFFLSLLLSHLNMGSRELGCGAGSDPRPGKPLEVLIAHAALA